MNAADEKRVDKRSFAGWQFEAGKKASKTMRWLSDSNLSVKNISPHYQVGSTVKGETAILGRKAWENRLLAAKKQFCKKMKLGLGAKRIEEMSYYDIRALGMAALVKSGKNACVICGGDIDNLLEGVFRSTRLYHHMCAARDDDQKKKRSRQIRALLRLHNHKEKYAQVAL